VNNFGLSIFDPRAVNAYRFITFPNLIMALDARSSGPEVKIPLRHVLLSKEPPTFLGINPQSSLGIH
jgi:hypothetical protein